MRGAAFSNKQMANKKTAMKFKNRMQAKIMAERSQHQVGAYGGLGAHGLDFGEGDQNKTKNHKKEVEGSFSGSVTHLAPQLVDSEDEDYLLNDNDDALKEELAKIDTEVKSQEIELTDQAPHELPDSDEGYVKVLYEKFRHTSFREG